MSVNRVRSSDVADVSDARFVSSSAAREHPKLARPEHELPPLSPVLSECEIATLQQVADSAREQTRSSGVAIAWGDSRRMVCVVSSGDSAPTPGAMIDARTGLARECIRTGEVASCADAATDLRISHQACETLGIASLVYIPVHDPQGKVTGLLGSFSKESFHFTAEDARRLKLIADSTYAALTSEKLDVPRSFAVAEIRGELEVSAVFEGAASEETQSSESSEAAEDTCGLQSRRLSFRTRIPLLAVAALIVCVSTGGWFSNRGSNGLQARTVASTAAFTEKLKVSEPGTISRLSQTITGAGSGTAGSGAKLRIVIDPGHGGRDVGTTSPTGLAEKDLTLDIARRLASLLHDRLHCDVVLTRNKDKYVGLESRARIANEAQGDLLISVHGNASLDEEVRGVETFYFRSLHESIAGDSNYGANFDSARSFAAAVQTALVSGLREGNHTVRDRGVKPASFVVLREVQMPAILAEISFISSSKDAEKLSSDEYRERVAKSLYKGIANHLSHTESQEVSADLNRNARTANR